MSYTLRKQYMGQILPYGECGPSYIATTMPIQANIYSHAGNILATKPFFPGFPLRFHSVYIGRVRDFY